MARFSRVAVSRDGYGRGVTQRGWGEPIQRKQHTQQHRIRNGQLGEVRFLEETGSAELSVQVSLSVCLDVCSGISQQEWITVVQFYCRVCEACAISQGKWLEENPTLARKQITRTGLGGAEEGKVSYSGMATSS